MTLLRGTSNSGCWFARIPGAGPCDGRLVRCHLLTRQVIRREWKSLMHGDALMHAFRERARGRGDLPGRMRDIIDDPRTWVWGCGGAMGPGGHHGMFKPDGQLPVPRERLPVGLEEIVAELDGLLGREPFGVFLDRTYGPLAVAA